MIELLRRFLGPYKLKALVGVLTKAVEVVFEVLTPLVVARMIDLGVRRGNMDEVLRMGLVLLVFALVSYAFTFVCQKLAARVSQGLGTDVRNALYHHINHLSAAEIDRFGTPSLVTRVTNDVNQVQLAVAFAIRMLTRWPLLAIGSMVAAISINVRLGLVFVVCMPAIALVFGLVMRASVPLFRQMQKKLDRISLVTRETLAGMRVIRAFRQEDAEQQRGRDAIYDQANTAIAVGRLSALLNPATFLIMNLGVAAILWVGGANVNEGSLTTGEVMAFVSYMTQALVAITVMGNLVVVLMRGQASSVRIMEVLNCQPSVEDENNTSVDLTANPQAAALELRNVSFTYPGANVPALDNVSLSLAPGQTLGIIGGTGSGKSTLVDLLPRLYDATQGSVDVFGSNVRSYPLVQLRQVVSVVPQSVSLVSGTIRTNLCWRNPSATDEELWQALRTAQAEDFVHKLPRQLDAPVEAKGKNFSGGQRQRLTIARSLVGAPRVVVLDDAASALDFATDARLRAALQGLGSTLTSIIVSQRVSSVMHASKILVLDHGRLAGLGTHGELLQTCALYREICASQLQGEAAGIAATRTAQGTTQKGEVEHG
ncbi:MAG: ABC transporter ATP-binding protein [Coriobacteriales bacterium]|nr:ABC transporter ATP-binding protein [Coriobacteriales bacterium]